jgi:hypothetical protein
MPRKRFSTEQIITKLRQAEVELSGGLRPVLSTWRKGAGFSRGADLG